MPEAPQSLAERVNSVRRKAGDTVDFLGQSGAFGLAGGVVTNHVNKELGRKITEVQAVYDTFGPEATTTLLATRAARTAFKKLPGRAKVMLRSGARSVASASPLIRGVLSLAETLARRV